MKNCGGGAAHRRQLRHRFLVMQRRKTQLLGPGSSWMARWSYYGPWLELKGTGAVDPRRSRGAGRWSKAAVVLGRRWRLRGLGLGFREGRSCSL
jgi:hypothetical protein